MKLSTTQASVQTRYVHAHDSLLPSPDALGLDVIREPRCLVLRFAQFSPDLYYVLQQAPVDLVHQELLELHQ